MMQHLEAIVRFIIVLGWNMFGLSDKYEAREDDTYNVRCTILILNNLTKRCQIISNSADLRLDFLFGWNG